MKVKSLKTCSYLYLILPILIFFIGWLKPYVSIPLSLGIVFMLFILLRQSEAENDKIINKKLVIILSIAILIICILAGQGGLFYQSPDHHWRNAIFRDLINSEWPVYYSESNSCLDYYIGHWMVPSFVAKLFVPISLSLAWQIGNICLLLWTSLGILLSFLWLVKIIKAKNTKMIFLWLFIFLFFSGLDIVGTLLFNTSIFSQIHIEWWGTYYQFSSMSTQLFWVFNQSITAWLITMMFINEKSVRNFFVLIILCLPSAPLPFAGLIPLFAYKGIESLVKSIKDKKVKKFFAEVFSIQNIIALICILPVYYLYYTSNASASDNGFRVIKHLITLPQILKLFIFWFLEIGIYGIFIFPKYKKNGLFYVAYLSLLAIPLFAIGGACDFAMRASIPALLVCLFFIIDYLNKDIEKIDSNKYKISFKSIILIMIIMIGSITSFFEYGRAINTVIKDKNIKAVADNIITFSDKGIEEYKNFLVINPKEETIFFKYLTKGLN